MRRNQRNRNNGKKERIVMLASSAFVLAALTMTGVYMQAQNTGEEDDGYTIDFTALEDHAADKNQEIARNRTDSGNAVLEDDLDYMPMEAGSGLIQIPGLTDKEETQIPEGEDLLKEKEEEKKKDTEKDGEKNQEAEKEGSKEAPGGDAPREAPKQAESQAVKELQFSEAEGLLRPLEGEVLLPFSMDSSIYFSTLDQYKYNPALMLQAEEGTQIVACADGKVEHLFEDAEIGLGFTVELGNGYELTYGQLKELTVEQGSYIQEGDVIGVVGAPTKYFSVEGANLYLKLTADGIPVNPESLFR